MKKIIIFSIAIISLSFSVRAQHDHADHNGTTKANTAKQTSQAQLLNLYYDVKNALVNSDAVTAATKAGEFVKAANAIDMNLMTEAEHKAFMSLKEKLVSDAKHISETKDIAHQREHFKSFSDNFYSLAKAVKLSSQPVYQAYCPMKKAYWLSSEKAVKNPYYGKQMPNCRKVTETL